MADGHDHPAATGTGVPVSGSFGAGLASDIMSTIMSTDIPSLCPAGWGPFPIRDLRFDSAVWSTELLPRPGPQATGTPCPLRLATPPSTANGSYGREATMSTGTTRLVMGPGLSSARKKRQNTTPIS